MRVGRVIRGGDILFANGSEVSSGGVILSRQGTDDYVRFRVPDTNCPPLPEPDEPLDSGVPDEAEPARWLTNVPPQRTLAGWLVRWDEYVALGYSLPQPFTIRTRLMSVDVTQLPGVGYNQSYIVGCGAGLVVGSKWVKFLLAVATSFMAPRYAYFWVVKDDGAVQSYPLLDSLSGQVIPGGREVWVDVSVANGVATGALLFQDSDGTMKQATFPPGVVPSHTLGSGDFLFSILGHGQSSGGADIPPLQVPFNSITTLAGAPSSVTVSTPVVDMQSPVPVQVSHYPYIGTLEWRASDTPFGQNDPTPAWDNPSGEYRYWQARVMWGDSSQLLERIEFLVRGFKHIVTIPSVGRNVELWHAEGAFPKGGSKGVVSLERVPTEEGWELESQRLITVDR